MTEFDHHDGSGSDCESDCDVCSRCGGSLSRAPHLVISFADKGTARDCNFMKKIEAVRDGILRDILASCGVELSGISSERAILLARKLYFWKEGRRDYVLWRESAEGRAILDSRRVDEGLGGLIPG